MRLIFMGTPDFSVPALAALLQAGHQIAAVYSQPPRPAGRGHKEQPSPVHAFAASQGIEVRTPKSLKNPEAQAEFADFRADAAIVVAYGLILPKAILEAPRLGCFNIHASLLPRWRGAAPIQRAIEAGDAATGITIMQMDEGLDTGDMLLIEPLPISESMNAGELHDALSAMGGRMIVEALARLEAGNLPPTRQPEQGVTYAKKLGKEEGRIDWTLPATTLARRIQAFTPWPGVWCERDGERLKILKAIAVEGKGEPGRLLDDHLTVACGEDALRLLIVQRAGGAVTEAQAYLRGHPLPSGQSLS
jgi:methionyl-tRNA formyltransferase